MTQAKLFGVASTSLEAYHKLVKPHLAWSQTKVYNLILDASIKHFDMTNREIAAALNWDINRVTPRVKELREFGLVVLSSVRCCGVTGNKARAWKVYEFNGEGEQKQ